MVNEFQAGYGLKWLSYQADQLAIDPTQDVWALIGLSTIDNHARHEHSSCLLIKAGAYMMHIRCGICPAAKCKGRKVYIKQVSTLK